MNRVKFLRCISLQLYISATSKLNVAHSYVRMYVRSPHNSMEIYTREEVSLRLSDKEHGPLAIYHLVFDETTETPGAYKSAFCMPTRHLD